MLSQYFLVYSIITIDNRSLCYIDEMFPKKALLLTKIFEERIYKIQENI